jgi:hypothetical protein
MNDLGRFELHPILNIAGFLFLAGVGIWFLTRLDQEARRIVESRREWGYAISDYELEVKKWKKRTRLFYLGCTILCLAGTLFSAIPLLR